MKIMLLAVVLFFSGCSLKYESQPNVYLKISPQNEIAKSEESLDKVLQVRQIMGSDVKLVYVDENGFYNFYAYHRWEEPLQLQMQKLLAYDIGRSNMFEDVATNLNIINANLFLELDIFEFVQYLKADGASNITLHVRVRLVDEKGDSIANRSFSQVYEMQTTNPINTLDGYNHCYREFSKEVIGWIGKLRESDAI